MNQTSQTILLIDDDRAVTDALAFALERDGRTTIACADIESAEIALAELPVTHVVTDVQFTGAFGFEGLHFAHRLRAVAPHCRLILMSAHVTPALKIDAQRAGACAVLGKPFSVGELEAALGAFNSALEPPAYQQLRVASIDELLRGKRLSAAFQPIVRMERSGVSAYGFEALSRPREPWLGDGPSPLFDYAARKGRLADLNLVAMATAIESARQLPQQAVIFINLDPDAFRTPAVARALELAAKQDALPLERIVIELTEKSAFHDVPLAATIFQRLREHGVRFALDDYGSAWSHLPLIDTIRPSFIKISPAFGASFERDRTRERIVRSTVALARDFGCDTILEGVESVETAYAAADAGIVMLQGYLFGRPAEAARWIDYSPARCAA